MTSTKATQDEVEFIRQLGRGVWLLRQPQTRLAVLTKYRSALERRVEWDGIRPETVKTFADQQIESERLRGGRL